MKNGLFITIEGTDGSGKTTQIRRIEKYLSELGREVILLREPGGTDISEKIRPIVLDPASTEMSSTAEMLLYAAARAQLVAEVIRPALENGKVVICDRFVDSTFAYQGFGRGIEMETLETISRIAINGNMPDVTLFFDISPEVALQRRMAASEGDRIENENSQFHQRVYEGYLRLAEKYPQRIRRIDAGRPVDEVWEDVRKQLESLLTGSRRFSL